MNQVIKKDQVRVSAGEAVAAEGPVTRTPHAHGLRGPGVHLVRIDGRVQAIELTCRCGDVSVLEIDYDDTTHETEATS
jgi:hypothetical protein